MSSEDELQTGRIARKRSRPKFFAEEQIVPMMAVEERGPFTKNAVAIPTSSSDEEVQLKIPSQKKMRRDRELKRNLPSSNLMMMFNDQPQKKPKDFAVNLPTRRPQKRNNLFIRQEHDDKKIPTWRKLIHPAALRHSLRIVENEARNTIETVSQSLLECGETEESRRVQVRSAQHVSSIVKKVRERLRKEVLPRWYTRIEDVHLDDLAVGNQRKQDEIQAAKAQLKRIKKQRVIYQKELAQAKEERNNVQLNIPAAKSTGTEIHPLLKDMPKKSTPNVTSSTGSSVLMGLQRPTDEANLMSSLLAVVSSVYDTR